MKSKIFVNVCLLLIFTVRILFSGNEQKSLSLRNDFRIRDIKAYELTTSSLNIKFNAHIGDVQKEQGFIINTEIYNKDNNEKLNSKNYLFNPDKTGEESFEIKHVLPNVRYDYEAFVLLTVLDKNHDFVQMEIENIGKVSYEKDRTYITIEDSYFRNDSKKFPVVNNYNFPNDNIPFFRMYIKNENLDMVAGGTYLKISNESDIYKENLLYDGIIKNFTLDANESSILDIDIPELKPDESYFFELFIVDKQGSQISQTITANINMLFSGFAFSDILTDKVEQDKLFFSSTIGLMGDLDIQDSLNVKYKVIVKKDGRMKSFKDTIDVLNRGMSESIRFHIPFSFTYKDLECKLSLFKNDEEITNAKKTFTIDEIKKANRIYFEDVLSPLYHEPIAEFYEAGIISGYKDNTFRPSNNITRAEIMAILSGMLNLTEQATNTTRKSVFDDVHDNHWAKGFINIGNDLNLVSGYPGNMFRPERNISYAEIFTIAINLLGNLKSNTNDSLSWPQNVIALAEKEGLTKNISFENDEFATRKDVTLILWKIWRRR